MGNSEQLAYVAGIVDGEGSINISPTDNSFQLSLGVRMKEKKCLDRVLGVLGGSLLPDSQDGLWRFTCHSGQAAKACERLVPFLVGKKDQAELAVQYAECAKPQQGKKLSEEGRALRAAFSEKMAGLHVSSFDEGSDVGVKKDELTAYAAGLIDAEGSITIIKSGRGKLPAVLIQMTDTAPLFRMVRVFGGHVHEETRRTKKGKVVYSFRLTSNNASETCTAMLPFLIAKREQAEIVIRYQNNVNLWMRRLGFGNKGIPVEVRAKRDEMVLKVRSLNTSHKRAAAETNPEHPVTGEVIVRAFHDEKVEECSGNDCTSSL